MEEVATKEVFKRDVYNKMENLAKIIKSKLQTSLGPEEKQKLLKYITIIIISFQVDQLYTKTVNKSGIISVLKIFGFDESKAEKIKSLCNNGVSVALLALLIFKNLKQ